MLLQHVSEVSAFDDLDAPVCGSEVAARLANPRGSDEDALCGAFVVRHASEGVDGSKPTIRL
jgi:hypothetical protein